MDNIYELTLLFDFYGPLLTERQRKILELHLYEDLSLGEIASELRCSRQAVSDSLRKAKQSLFALEEKLLLVEKHSRALTILEECEKNYPQTSDIIEQIKTTIV